MQNWRAIAQGAKDLLTVCLAKTIDQALSARFGGDWFARFAEADGKEKVSARITKGSQKSVEDLDLQALLKFMRYRSEWVTSVLDYYGFYAGLDEFAADAQRRQLDALLDRLINDFRNRIEAHSRAADIASELSGQGVERIYGYEEAYHDMVRLTRIFAKDPVGKIYYRRMVRLTGKKKWWLIPAAAALVAAVVAVVLLVQPKDHTYHNDAAPVCVVGEVTLQPIQISYDDDEIVAVCYVINGTNQVVSQIDVYSFRLLSGGKTVAAADFGTLEKLEIEPGESVVWSFRFPESTIREENADLEKIDTIAFCQYQ